MTRGCQKENSCNKNRCHTIYSASTTKDHALNWQILKHFLSNHGFSYFSLMVVLELLSSWSWKFYLNGWKTQVTQMSPWEINKECEWDSVGDIEVQCSQFSQFQRLNVLSSLNFKGFSWKKWVVFCGSRSPYSLTKLNKSNQRKKISETLETELPFCFMGILGNYYLTHNITPLAPASWKHLSQQITSSNACCGGNIT